MSTPSGKRDILKLSHLANLNVGPEIIKYISYNIQFSTSTIKNAIVGKVYLDIYLLAKDKTFGMLKIMPFLVCKDDILLEASHSWW